MLWKLFKKLCARKGELSALGMLISVIVGCQAAIAGIMLYGLRFIR